MSFLMLTLKAKFQSFLMIPCCYPTLFLLLNFLDLFGQIILLEGVLKGTLKSIYFDQWFNSLIRAPKRAPKRSCSAKKRLWKILQKSAKNMYNCPLFAMTFSVSLLIFRLFFVDNTSTRLILVLEKNLNFIEQLLFCQEYHKKQGMIKV